MKGGGERRRHGLIFPVILTPFSHTFLLLNTCSSLASVRIFLLSVATPGTPLLLLPLPLPLPPSLPPFLAPRVLWPWLRWTTG